MDMQLLRDCETCHRRFAVQYEFGAPRVPSWGSDRVHVRVVRCPSCRHLNPLVMLMYAHHVVVKSAAGLEPAVRAIPKGNLMVAAIDLLSRIRARLP
jgi:hypothetical protein